MRVVLWVVTLLRVALLPPFVVIALRAQAVAGEGGDPATLRGVAVLLLVVIGLSDVVDGWIARRFDLVTQFGAFADAAADKLVQVTVVTFFVLADGSAFGSLPFWFLVLLVARDLVLGIGWAAIRARTPIVVIHRAHGRIGSVGVFVLVLGVAIGLPQTVVLPFVVVLSLLVLASTVGYSRDGLAQLPGRRGDTA